MNACPIPAIQMLLVLIQMEHTIVCVMLGMKEMEEIAMVCPFVNSACM